MSSVVVVCSKLSSREVVAPTVLVKESLPDAAAADVAVTGWGPASSQLTASFAVVVQGGPTFAEQSYTKAMASRPSECLRVRGRCAARGWVLGSIVACCARVANPLHREGNPRRVKKYRSFLGVKMAAPMHLHRACKVAVCTVAQHKGGGLGVAFAGHK
jgi:hypothetical protein